MDVDDDALQIAASNCAQFEDLHVDFLRMDVTRLPARLTADTVVTCAALCATPARRLALTRAAAARRNPPFGSRRKGADTEFLQAACAAARKTVYSLHKARAGGGRARRRYAQRSHARSGAAVVDA